MRRVLAYFAIPAFFKKSLGIARFLYPLSVILVGPGGAPGFTHFFSRVLLLILLLFVGGRIASNVLSSSIRSSPLPSSSSSSSSSLSSSSFPSLLSSSFSDVTPVSFYVSSESIPTPIPVTPISAFAAPEPDLVPGIPYDDSDNRNLVNSDSNWILCQSSNCLAFCSDSNCSSSLLPDNCIPSVCVSENLSSCLEILLLNGYRCLSGG